MLEEFNEEEVCSVLTDAEFEEEYDNMPFYVTSGVIEDKRTENALDKLSQLCKDIHHNDCRYVSCETYEKLLSIYSDLGRERPICGIHVYSRFELQGTLLVLVDYQKSLWLSKGTRTRLEREIIDITTSILRDIYFDGYMYNEIVKDYDARYTNEELPF